MPERWRQILERLEDDCERRDRWAETHPPITRISKKEADATRNIKALGQEAVTCDLPCSGNYVPNEYSHTLGIVNVFNKDIRVEGWENPPEGVSAYYGTTCGLTEGKVCATNDERLRKSIER